MKKSNLYFCYSIPLLRFLKNKGLWYLYQDVNPSTNRTYWIFAIDDDLSASLTEWSKNKPVKQNMAV